LGGGLIETSSEQWMTVVGVTLELVNVLAVVAIAVVLWTPFRQRCPAMALGYVSVRTIEAGFCAAAALIPITLLRRIDDAELLDAVRGDIVGYAIPISFGIGATLLYVMLYRTGLVPRFIAVWGMIAAPAVILANTVVIDPVLTAALVLPIIGNEVFLGIYLIAKGFRSPVAEPSNVGETVRYKL
ncbi:MAG: DUF4386 domain-containing protein, partial [Cryobacterium sp.]|nr:DUF4386 domain-containing protein [Cryobacterium sp.]